MLFGCKPPINSNKLHNEQDSVIASKTKTRVKSPKAKIEINSKDISLKTRFLRKNTSWAPEGSGTGEAPNEPQCQDQTTGRRSFQEPNRQGGAFNRAASRLSESNGRRGTLSTDTHDHAKYGKRLRRQQDQQSKMGGRRSRNQDRRNGEVWVTISVSLRLVRLEEAFAKQVLVSTYEIFEILMGRSREEGGPRGGCVSEQREMQTSNQR